MSRPVQPLTGNGAVSSSPGASSAAEVSRIVALVASSIGHVDVARDVGAAILFPRSLFEQRRRGRKERKGKEPGRARYVSQLYPELDLGNWSRDKLKYERVT